MTKKKMIFVSGNDKNHFEQAIFIIDESKLKNYKEKDFVKIAEKIVSKQYYKIVKKRRNYLRNKRLKICSLTLALFSILCLGLYLFL